MSQEVEFLGFGAEQCVKRSSCLLFYSSHSSAQREEAFSPFLGLCETRARSKTTFMWQRDEAADFCRFAYHWRRLRFPCLITDALRLLFGMLFPDLMLYGCWRNMNAKRDFKNKLELKMKNWCKVFLFFLTGVATVLFSSECCCF